MPTQSAPDRRKSAFTLVEMLIVIAIMSILMTAGTIGLNGMGGKSVTSGVTSAESLFDEARTIAVGRNIRACVLVSNSLTNNHGDDRRRVLVASEEVDDKTGLPISSPDQEPTWVLTTRGTVLPDKVYFSALFSKKNQTGGGGEIDKISDDKIKNVTTGYKGSYFIYQFNDQGICKTPGASFILGTGSRNPGKSATVDEPRVTGEAKRDFGGFVVRRSGRTSLFRSTDQMPGLEHLNAGAKF